MAFSPGLNLIDTQRGAGVVDDFRPESCLPVRRPSVVVLAVHHVHTSAGCVRGGAEKYVRDTVARLLEAGANIHVNYSGDSIYDGLAPTDSDQRFILDRTDWLDPDLGRDRRLKPATVAKRARWFAHHRPDVVFVVQQQSGGAFAASIVGAAMVGCPVVTSIRQMPIPSEHHVPVPDRRRRRRLSVWRQLPVWRMRAVASCCHSLIFNSHRVADQYVARYGLNKSRIRVIRNCEPLAQAPRSRLPPEPARFLVPNRTTRTMIGTIGQLSPNKAPSITLEAFARIASRFPAADLVFFGDGPLAEPLQKLAANLNIAERVHFAGYVHDRDTAFANIDLFVLPSQRESSSNAVAEAMARGLPCIVSDTGGLPELVRSGESGLVVPPDDAASLSAALARLLDDPSAAQKMGDAAYARAGRLLDPATNGRATLEAILNACGSRLESSIALTRSA